MLRPVVARDANRKLWAAYGQPQLRGQRGSPPLLRVAGVLEFVDHVPLGAQGELRAVAELTGHVDD